VPGPDVAERNGYACQPFAAAGWSHDVYRGGEGPAILLLHEMPSFSWRTVRLANYIRDHGYRIVMPILVGGIREGPIGGLRGGLTLAAEFTVNAAKICISREFVALLQHRTSPVTDYLLALARAEADASGRPKVGVIGMCFSGGFALATAIDPVVGVAVASQPALPFAMGPLGLIPGQAADLGLSESDRLALVARKDDPSLCVRAFRFTNDRIAPAARVERIERELSPGATLTPIASADPAAHSVLTDATDVPKDPSTKAAIDMALASVIATLDERLKT
jgi:dienelactone hydrolase